MLWLSTAKPLTVVMIAQLFENGELSLDDPVTRVVPEFEEGGKGGVTIRHLLTHTGGFRGADQHPAVGTWVVRRKVEGQEDSGRDLPWGQIIRRICATPLEPGWVPGEKAGYHTGSSWFILAEIVERIRREPFATCLRQSICDKLGMTNTFVGVPLQVYHHQRADRRGRVYASAHGELRPHPAFNTENSWTACRPGSNGRGPIRELGCFYEALLSAWSGEDAKPGTTPILKPETGRLFTTRQRVGMFDHTFDHVVDWGFGFVINSNRYGAETVPYGYGPHASEDTFGHSGAQSSAAFADPKHGLVVAWVCNGLPGEPRHQRRARALNAAIYEDLALA
jgi:CubicO group peptidase (beta-lactamase class C family)